MPLYVSSLMDLQTKVDMIGCLVQVKDLYQQGTDPKSPEWGVENIDKFNRTAATKFSATRPLRAAQALSCTEECLTFQIPGKVHDEVIRKKRQ
jgi:hypothetical protein